MMKKFFLVIVAIELLALIYGVSYYGDQALDKLERVASELEYLSDRPVEVVE